MNPKPYSDDNRSLLLHGQASRGIGTPDDSQSRDSQSRDCSGGRPTCEAAVVLRELVHELLVGRVLGAHIHDDNLPRNARRSPVLDKAGLDELSLSQAQTPMGYMIVADPKQLNDLDTGISTFNRISDPRK